MNKELIMDVAVEAGSLVLAGMLRRLIKREWNRRCRISLEMMDLNVQPLSC